ncbi:MAG: enoyl-CoA hydratase/isomerase family protein [Bacteroidetes bacterium]|nr:enoyl-CoA hydratase/isomerase family protein [Bacteroidota bacterium]
MYETIELERSKSIITVWLSRPELHNAMNDVMIAELTQVFRDFSEDEDLRMAILRGRGESFCAGADLNYMKNIADFGLEENLKDSIKLAQLFNTISECSIPTISLVHGACFGGANGLIAACDIVIAAINTVFAFSEVRIGIAPATIAPFVIRRIGEYGAKELMITGKRFNGEEALKWKLVNHVFVEKDLESELEKYIAQILSSGPNAVKASKELITQILRGGRDLADTEDYTTKMITELRASDEGQEGMASFLEKRKPNWISDESEK